MIKEISTEESISRILSTMRQKRVMRPQYGSNLFMLVDKNIDSEWELNAIEYCVDAIKKNEPRVEVDKVKIIKGEKTEILISYKENNKTKTVKVGL